MKHYMQRNLFCKVRMHWPTSHWQAVSDFIKMNGKLTSDKTILDIVRGYKIDFMLPPVATSVRQSRFTQIEEKALQKVIDDLLEKQVIERSTHKPGEFISPVFYVSRRM